MIAYYVHHHGTGHVQRAVAISGHLGVPVVGLSSREAPSGWPGDWVTLPDDATGVDPAADDVTARSTFHWAPLHHAGFRERMGRISDVVVDGRIRLLVSDVSVEVTVLGRLHGIPVVVMAQPGERTDRAHRSAYDLAERLLAPWPATPVRPWPPRWLAKTVHLGGVSRFDGRTTQPPTGGRDGPGGPGAGGRVLVMWGSGGLDVSMESLTEAARATPAWEWQVAGPPSRPAAGESPPNLADLGWVDDPWPLLSSADVVITHAGQNAIAEVAAARRPAVVIPQRRPFAEQEATADALRDSGMAVVVSGWPAATAWAPLLADAVRGGGRHWDRWSTGGGAQRAAEEIEALAVER